MNMGRWFKAHREFRTTRTFQVNYREPLIISNNCIYNGCELVVQLNKICIVTLCERSIRNGETTERHVASVSVKEFASFEDISLVKILPCIFDSDAWDVILVRFV